MSSGDVRLSIESTSSKSSGDASQDSNSKDSASIVSNGGSEDGASFLSKSTWSILKRCHICNKKLGKLLGRRKHHCRFCGHTVCRKHSSNRRFLLGKSKSVRICDKCHKEILNRGFNSALLDEIGELRITLGNCAKQVQEQRVLDAEANNEIQKLRIELEEAERVAKEAKQNFENRIKEEGIRLVKNRSIVENLESALKESTYSRRLAQERCEKKEIIVSSCRSDVDHLKEQEKALQSNLEEGVKDMQERVHITQLMKCMCEKCRPKLYHMSFSESNTEPSQNYESKRVRSNTTFERKSCAGDCILM